MKKLKSAYNFFKVIPNMITIYYIKYLWEGAGGVKTIYFDGILMREDVKVEFIFNPVMPKQLIFFKKFE